MTNTPDQAASDKAIADFSTSVEHLNSQVTELQSVLSRTVQALTRHGVQLSVDLDSMVRDMQDEVSSVQKRSRRVVAQLDQQRELVRTIALITSSLELDQVLAEVMDTVIHLTGAERAYLMLHNEKEDDLTIRAARNWDRETISDDDAQFSRSIVNEAIDKMEPVVAMNAQGDARYQEAKSVVQQGLRSILCIPLAMQGRVMGVLYADNRIEQGIFSQDDVPLLTAFGTQAAIAIQNARLYERVQDDLRETKRELQDLKIQIDQHKVREQVSEITDSAYFERLSAEARKLRQRNYDRSSGSEGDA